MKNASSTAVAAMPYVSFRYVAIALSAVLLVVAAATIDVVPFGRAFWDYIFVINGAYRIEAGQIPHVDFMSPIGALTLYLTRAAEILFPHGQPLIGIHALMWLLLMPILWVLASRFESNLAFFLAFAILALITLMPYTVDQSHIPQISLFAIYNRFASSLLFLLGLWYVLPKRKGDPWMLAYALVILFFLKITAAVAAIVLLLCAAVLQRASARSIGLALLGAIGICILIELPTGIVSGYFRDLVQMVEVGEGSMIYRLAFAGYMFWLPLAVTSGLVLFIFWQVWSTKPKSPAGFRSSVVTFWTENAFLVDVVILVAMALAVESQNTGGVGLISAAAVLFHPDAFEKRNYRFVGTIVLGVALLFPLIDLSFQRTVKSVLRDKTGTTDHAFAPLAPGFHATHATLEAANLMQRMYRDWMPFVRDVRKADFTFEHDPAMSSLSSSAAWAENAVEAADVFRERNYGELANNYAVLSFADPFTKYLGLMPAKHVNLVVDFGRTLSVPTERQASEYLASADGVFVPRCDHVPNAEDLERGFHDLLETEFRPLPLNACWTFYVRKREPQSFGSKTPERSP